MISCESFKNTYEAGNKADEDDTFGYRLNFLGFPFILFSAYRYAQYMCAEAANIIGESSIVDVILKLRYVWTVGYFLAVMLLPGYTVGTNLAEVPLLVGTALEVYSYIVGIELASLLRLLLLTVITGGLVILKKRPKWTDLLNFWREDEFQPSVVDSSV